MKKYLALLLAVAMLCMALAGCGNSSGGSSAGTGQFGQDGREIAKDQTYRSVYGAEVETMNYLVTGTTNNLVAGANVIDALVENDQFGKIVACGAKDWKITDNADGTQTWTFYLREDAYWYDKDGNKKDQVTAHDYVASMVYVNDAKNDSANQYLTAWIVGAQDYYDWTYAVANAVPETHEHVQVGYFDIGSEIPEFVKKANGDICEVDYVTYKDADGNNILSADGKTQYKVTGLLDPVKPAKPEDIKCTAVNDFTLEYVLDKARPYFLTGMGYGCFWPAPKTLLASCYDADGNSTFGTSDDTMWYNGAYILQSFKPQEERIYVKNEGNWDAKNVHITKIEQTYNSDSSNVAMSLYQQGQISGVGLSSDVLDAWMKDPETAKMVSPTRVSGDYSYFYGFCFDPNVANSDKHPEGITEADDAAWAKAAANLNFRKAIFYALNREKLYKISYPQNYKDLILNTVSPKNQYMATGKDYVTYGDLNKIASGANFNFNETEAKKYAAAAKTELQAAGVTFPIKCVVNYNGGTDWGNECTVLKQDLETLLGSDFIEVVIFNYGSQSFLAGTRRNRNYHLQKLNWGADYADPETWTDPFTDDNSYTFAFRSPSKEVQDIHKEYVRLVEVAKTKTQDMDERYAAFAAAEYYYLENAMIIPYGITGGSYQVTHLNVFEGQYASYGQASSRYKGQWIYTTPMSQEMFDSEMAKWQAQVSAK